MEKFTKKEMFAEIIALANGADHKASAEEIISFANHEIELLSKKHSSSKPSKTQVENEKIKETILAVLGGMDKPVRVSELMAQPELPYNNQKLTSLLKQLAMAGAVVRTELKGNAYYSIA